MEASCSLETLAPVQADQTLSKAVLVADGFMTVSVRAKKFFLVAADISAHAQMQPARHLAPLMGRTLLPEPIKFMDVVAGSMVDNVVPYRSRS